MGGEEGRVKRKREIERLLKQALLQGGKMEYALYEYELEEHIENWYAGLIADGEEFVFVATENSGDVAIVLITEDKRVYANEEARDALLKLWPQTYKDNMKLLIPMMAGELAKGFFAVNGVKTVQGDGQK
jgi:hypothetical protein